MSKTTKTSKTASKPVIESTSSPITVTTSSVVEKAPKEKKPKVSKKTESVVNCTSFRRGFSNNRRCSTY